MMQDIDSTDSLKSRRKAHLSLVLCNASLVPFPRSKTCRQKGVNIDKKFEKGHVFQNPENRLE